MILTETNVVHRLFPGKTREVIESYIGFENIERILFSDFYRRLRIYGETIVNHYNEYGQIVKSNREPCLDLYMYYNYSEEFIEMLSRHSGKEVEIIKL